MDGQSLFVLRTFSARSLIHSALLQFEGDGLRSGEPKDEGFAPSSFDEGSQLVNSMAAASLASVKEEEGPVGHFRLAFATLEEDAMKQVRPFSLT